MEPRKAGEIWDYLTQHQTDEVEDIALALDLPLENMSKLILNWSTRSRGEFIFLLTKTDE